MFLGGWGEEEGQAAGKGEIRSQERGWGGQEGRQGRQGGQGWQAAERGCMGMTKKR